MPKWAQDYFSPPYDQVRGERIITALLAVFLGSFGIHKFYLHKIFQGILYILFSWTGIPGFIGILEGLRFLFMSNRTFYYDYYVPKHQE